MSATTEEKTSKKAWLSYIPLVLLALTFIDADTQLLPDDLTLPLLWAGLSVNLFGLFVPLAEAVVGALLPMAMADLARQHGHLPSGGLALVAYGRDFQARI